MNHEIVKIEAQAAKETRAANMQTKYELLERIEKQLSECTGLIDFCLHTFNDYEPFVTDPARDPEGVTWVSDVLAFSSMYRAQLETYKTKIENYESGVIGRVV